MKKYMQYVENIPEETKLAIRSLQSEIRQAILVLLSRNVELSFSDICRELGIDKVKLNFHLKNLFSSALVDHYYRHEVGNPNYSYYAVTPLGRRVLSYLIQAFIPPLPTGKGSSLEGSRLSYVARAHDASSSYGEIVLSGRQPKVVTVSSYPSVREGFQLRNFSNDPGKYLRSGEQEL